jgi:hypothetical protein
MKYITLLSLVLLAGLRMDVIAQKSETVSVGIHVMIGARYDNIRMCVASPGGAKGGLIADVMLDVKFSLTDKVTLGINVPVMRPILFAAAFKMLQFEPAVSLEFKHKIAEDRYVVLGPSIGASFHYGPDYRSDKDNKGESFFAAGPFISQLFGLTFRGSSGRDKIIGLRAFYAPLFSSDSDLSPGTVVGGALEWHFDFK